MSDFFQRTLGENITLELIGGAGLWQVEVDPSQMEAAILNLVVNAKDAMAGKGKLTIETVNVFVDEAPGPAERRAFPPGDMSGSPSAIPAWECRRTFRKKPSIRSSPPSSRGRAPDWD